MVFGFQKYCEVLFHLFPGCEVKTSRTNPDNLEQFFGRQRAQNGQNNNPTESQYGKYTDYLISIMFFIHVTKFLYKQRPLIAGAHF